MPGNLRQAILDAALAVFSEHGRPSDSLGEIRERAGASVGSLYHWFPGGRRDVETALFVEFIAEYQAGFLAALEAESDAADGIRAVVDAHLAWVESHPDRARYLLAQSPDQDDPALSEANAAFFQRVREWLEPRIAAGEIRSASIVLLHALWLGPSQELSRHWLAGRTESRPTANTEALQAAAWASLRNRAAQI